MTHSFSLTRWRRAAWAALGAAVLAAGCSETDPNRVAVFPAEGTVTLNGKPLPGAMVVLHPKKSSDPRVLPARGHVGPDGKFVLTTYDGNDGAAAGEYAVTVTYYEPIRQGDSVSPGPNVLPRKYENPTTTDLTVQVAEGPNQLPPLTLKR